MNREDATKVVVALGLAAFLLSFLFATLVDRDAWFDESFTIATVHLMEKGSVDFAHYDVHPPGYYQFAEWWMQLNPGIAEHMWLRYFSALCVGIFIIFCGLTLLLIIGQWEAVAATILMTVNTTILWYGQESRMYAVVLVCSAMAIYFVLQEAQEGKQQFGNPLVWLLLFFLPLLHYLAAVAVCFILLVMLIFEYLNKRKWYRVVLAGIFGGVGTIFSGITYALPQHMRVSNLWFPPPDVYSAISGMFYALHIVADKFDDAKSTLILFIFLTLLCIVVWGAIRLKSEEKKEEIFLKLAISTLVFPILGVIFGAYTGIYHHRFYLCVTWLFACGFYIMLMKRWKWTVGVFFVLSIIFIGILVQYELTQDKELQTMASYVPCGSNITVVHETPFTYFPFETYGRERCGQDQWHDILVTGFNVTEGHSAGLDAINESDIVRVPEHNLTLQNFYFVDGGMHYINGTGCLLYKGVKGNLTQVGVTCVK